jgi:ribosomal-protein-alanine N-acetyltransferase
MIGLIGRWLARPEPSLSEAGPGDAAALATLHAASFGRGWSEDEFASLLLDKAVISHRAVIGSALAGFVLSRVAGDEAEILSIAVARASQGRGLARKLLDLHLRRLAGIGVAAVFLEVDETNTAARRLYDRAGFRKVGQRPAYYPRGTEGRSAALVLRRDLA